MVPLFIHTPSGRCQPRQHCFSKLHVYALGRLVSVTRGTEGAININGVLRMLWNMGGESKNFAPLRKRLQLKTCLFWSSTFMRERLKDSFSDGWLTVDQPEILPPDGCVVTDVWEALPNLIACIRSCAEGHGAT